MILKSKPKITFIQANFDHLTKLAQLEKEVWGNTGANKEQIHTRIQSFPAGNIIAIHKGRIVGYVVFQYVNDLVQHADFTWSEITDQGTLKKSHQINGEFVYGVNLSVHRSMTGYQLGNALILQVWANMIEKNKRGCFVGSRIPGFKKYLNKHPNTTVIEYVQLRHRGKARDPELRLYESEGLKVIKVLPDYFPDPPSLNYGVLIYRDNPFYNIPAGKTFLAWLFKKIAPATMRATIGTKNKGDDNVQPEKKIYCPIF